jgi:ketosteroid isomerase-like protein
MKSTGTAIDAQFAHVWELRDDKAIHFQQYTDSAMAQST